MNSTLIDSLRHVLQNMRLQRGEMAKIQADIVGQAIMEIETLNCRIEELKSKIVTECESDEQARIQHEIKMTDDHHYREWYRKEQRRKEIEEHGIDE